MINTLETVQHTITYYPLYMARQLEYHELQLMMINEDMQGGFRGIHVT